MQLHTEATISAAHHLPNYDGKCANVHGHTWKIEVDIDGSVDKKTGMIVDFSKIKSILDKLDHTDINTIIPNPTAENIVTYINSEIHNLGYFHDVKVKVWESATSWACDNY